MIKLAKQAIFRTIQGEGVLTGEPMIFLRLGGCSIGCPECDTDYKTVENVSIGEILQRIENMSRKGDWIWLTGGEPTDQDLTELVVWLKKLGHPVALATAGTKVLPNGLYNWISVSPHSKNIKQISGHELKIVPGLNGLKISDIVEMNITMFAYKYIQPLWESDYKECIDFVLKNPGWRLGLQNHKYWNIL